MNRARTVTDADIALLEALRDAPSVMAASRRLGIPRDRAVYRLSRLGSAFGGPVVVGRKGGSGHGGTRLSALGERIVRGGYGAVALLDARATSPPPQANRLRGTYRGPDDPTIELAPGVALRVAFPAEAGETVDALLDPDSILVARHKFPTSARNVLAARVVSLERGVGPGGRTLLARVGPLRLRATVTAESGRRLGLAPGRPVWLYIKATAVRRVGRPKRARRPGNPPRRRSVSAR